MCAVQFADDYNNVDSRSKLPPQLWLMNSILELNACPLGHKTQQLDQFLQVLYAFHKGHWYFIPALIWSQIHKFWVGLHSRGASATNSWGLPFPFLLTYILKKKGIKRTSIDGLVKEHPYFGQIQWNQSYSHMPRIHQAPVAEAEGVEEEPMNMEELATAQGGEKESVTIGRTNYQFFHDEMAFFWFEIVDIRQEEWEDWYLENQCLNRLEQRIDKQEGMLRAILERLPTSFRGIVFYTIRGQQ
jgi:hypothetical protein